MSEEYTNEYLAKEAEMLLQHPVLNLAVATMVEEATNALVHVKPDEALMVSILQQRVQIAEGLLEELQSLVLAKAETETSAFYEDPDHIGD